MRNAQTPGIARNFINAHSTTAIETNTDKLIIAHAPETDSDLSLSLAKNWGRR